MKNPDTHTYTFHISGTTAIQIEQVPCPLCGGDTRSHTTYRWFRKVMTGRVCDECKYWFAFEDYRRSDP